MDQEEAARRQRLKNIFNGGRTVFGSFLVYLTFGAYYSFGKKFDCIFVTELLSDPLIAF